MRALPTHRQEWRTTTPAQAAEPHPLLHEVTGSGDPIVLMPGGLSGWASFESLAERLTGHRRVVRAQLRHVELVESGEPIPASYSVATERDALLETVDALGLDRFDLLGWSSGGVIALAFAIAHPERVHTLTLIEPAAFWILRETGHAREALAAETAWFRQLDGREITVDDLKAFLARARLGTNFESHPRWPIWVRNRQSLSVGTKEINHTDSIDRLRSLDVPILAIKGRETAEALASIVDDIAATAPNVTLLELPGGHACHLENFERFLDALEAHVANGGTS